MFLSMVSSLMVELTMDFLITRECYGALLIYEGQYAGHGNRCRLSLR